MQVQVIKNRSPVLHCQRSTNHKSNAYLTRRGTYYTYLVKWAGLPEEDATWMTQAEIEKAGYKFDTIPNSRDLSSFEEG